MAASEVGGNRIGVEMVRRLRGMGVESREVRRFPRGGGIHPRALELFPAEVVVMHTGRELLAGTTVERLRLRAADTVRKHSVFTA